MSHFHKFCLFFIHLYILFSLNILKNNAPLPDPRNLLGRKVLTSEGTVGVTFLQLLCGLPVPPTHAPVSPPSTIQAPIPDPDACFVPCGWWMLFPQLQSPMRSLDRGSQREVPWASLQHLLNGCLHRLTSSHLPDKSPS